MEVIKMDFKIRI